VVKEGFDSNEEEPSGLFMIIRYISIAGNFFFRLACWGVVILATWNLFT